MDDLNSTLGAILNDPAKMAQLRAVAESLGLNPGGPPPPQQNAAPAGNTGNTGNPANTTANTGNTGNPANTGNSGGIDPAAIASILQNFQNASGGGSQNGGAANSGLGNIGAISQVLATMNQSDKNVELLRSLKPHFSTTRAGRIDDAVRIMQLLKAWPALRDSGLLSGLGNLLGGGRR